MHKSNINLYYTGNEVSSVYILDVIISSIPVFSFVVFPVCGNSLSASCFLVSFNLQRFTLSNNCVLVDLLLCLEWTLFVLKKETFSSQGCKTLNCISDLLKLYRCSKLYRTLVRNNRYTKVLSEEVYNFNKSAKMIHVENN